MKADGKPRKLKTHYVTLRLKFDWPVDRSRATKAAKRALFKSRQNGETVDAFDIVRVIPQ